MRARRGRCERGVRRCSRRCSRIRCARFVSRRPRDGRFAGRSVSRPSAARSNEDRRIVAAQELAGDRPEAHLNLANLASQAAAVRRGPSGAELCARNRSGFVPAPVNLAGLFGCAGATAMPTRSCATRSRARKEPRALTRPRPRARPRKRSPEALAPLAAAARFAADNRATARLRGRASRRRSATRIRAGHRPGPSSLAVRSRRPFGAGRLPS